MLRIIIDDKEMTESDRRILEKKQSLTSPFFLPCFVCLGIHKHDAKVNDCIKN